MSGTPGHRFESATWHSFARCRNRKLRWDHWARPLSPFCHIPVRVITAVVARKQTFSAEELRPGDYQRWRDLRAYLQQCEETRRQQFRFRKNPAAYLAALEAQLLT